MAKENILTALKERIIVADGAFGTELYGVGVPLSKCFEYLNIEDPAIPAEVHRRYISSGAEAGDGAEVRVGVWVAGSIGPLGRFEKGDPGTDEKTALFREQAEGLIAGGIDLFILETFNSLNELVCALKAVRSMSSLPVMAQLLFTGEGKTMSGDDPLTAFLMLQDGGADIVGANCGVGPRGISRVMKKTARYIDAFVSAFPNAGFPEKVGDRMIYLANEDYLARKAVEMVQDGVNLIGGCCGTRPADIASMKKALEGVNPAEKTPLSREQVSRRLRQGPGQQKSIVAGAAPEKRMENRRIISVELDPPRGLNYEGVIAGTRALKEAGADFISLAENPLASTRMSNITLARLIGEKVGIETIVHITCRDRNLIGMQSALMGMAVDGIRNILVMTGDPPSKGREESVRGVFDLTSVKLISLLRSMNEGRDYHGNDIKKKTAFTIGGVFNPNGANMEAQMKHLRRKIDGGQSLSRPSPFFPGKKSMRRPAFSRISPYRFSSESCPYTATKTNLPP